MTVERRIEENGGITDIITLTPEENSAMDEAHEIVSKRYAEWLIDMVDKCEAEDRNRAKETARDPVIKRCYCRHYAAGKCTYYSSSYLTNCNYPNDPGQCPAALMNKLLVYEFE